MSAELGHRAIGVNPGIWRGLHAGRFDRRARFCSNGGPPAHPQSAAERLLRGDRLVRARHVGAKGAIMRALYGTLIVLLNVLAAAAPTYAQAVPSPSIAPTSPVSDAPQGDVRNGEKEFSACVNCHGHHAEGGFGPDLAGRDLAWTTFRKAVREPWGIMPAFREQLKSEQALADIRAYLNSLPRTATLGEWHWRRAPQSAPLGQRLYMNFAGCGQCHEPEGKFPRARLGVAARDVTFEYFKRQIYQHYDRWPKGTMPLYSPDRMPEPVVREMYQWLVDELGLRPWIAGALTLGDQRGDVTTYRLTVSNNGEKDKGLAAEGLTV